MPSERGTLMIKENELSPVWYRLMAIGVALGLALTLYESIEPRLKKASPTVQPSFTIPPGITVQCTAWVANPCNRRGPRVRGDGPTVEAAVRAMQEDLDTIACE